MKVIFGLLVWDFRRAKLKKGRNSRLAVAGMQSDNAQALILKYCGFVLFDNRRLFIIDLFVYYV